MRQDDEARFREVYAAHVDRVLAYAMRRVLHAEDAGDIVAETFLVAWRRRRDLPDGEDAVLWLFGVARRVLANHRRTLMRRERLAARLGGQLRGALAARVAPDPADAVVAERTVREAMDRLGDLDREVLRLHAWEQLEPREIAVALDLAPAAVRTRLSRARARLRRELGDAADPSGHVSGVTTMFVPEENR
ncbi:RNA polymerase sigma factor [Nocardioides mangrovicus]|uniref:RNA polymerase sigma factor n=1 Tax=Nocardioides mangrovicus TaxID=2478913 RepID=UPI001E2BA2D6|nr:RNA polymerase sigma factor [Nocardioides mangrovicus]